MYSQLKASNSQGVLNGAGGLIGAVDLAEGHDLADVVDDVETAFGQGLVEGLGLGRQVQQAQEQLLVGGAAALLEQGPGMIGSSMSWWRSVTAAVAGDELVLMVNAQMIGIELESHGGPGVPARAPNSYWCPPARELAVGASRQDDPRS